MGAGSGSAETVSGPSKSAGTSLTMVVEHRPSTMMAATNAAMIHPPREESHPRMEVSRARMAETRRQMVRPNTKVPHRKASTPIPTLAIF